MAEYSFYGGPQGASFELAACFTSKVDMMRDLIQRNYSDVGVGEFVFISYGLSNAANSQTYTTRQQLDVDVFGRSYNGSLWQKVYIEKDDMSPSDVAEFGGAWREITEYPYIEKWYENVNYGFAYKLIAALSGNTPMLNVQYHAIMSSESPRVVIDNTSADFPILHFYLPRAKTLGIINPPTVLHSFDDPEVELSDITTDNPKLHFSLPQAQQILSENVTMTPVDADKDPTFVFNSSKTEQNGNGTLKADFPTINVEIPKSQVLKNENITFNVLHADEEPNFEWDESGSKINRPTVLLELPQSQRLVPDKVHLVMAEAGEMPSIEVNTTGVASDGVNRVDEPEVTLTLPKSQVIKEVTREVIDADQPPDVEWDDADKTKPSLKFYLPQSQTFGVLPIVPLGPVEQPRVEYDDATDVNNPTIQFYLPQVTKYVYGDLLGNKSAGSYVIDIEPEIEDLLVGDYYINIETGFTYRVISKDVDAGTVGFEFIASLKAALPRVSAEGIDPYEIVNGQYENKKPIVVSGYTNVAEERDWSIKIGLPRLPNFASAVEFLGPEEEGSVSSEITGASEYTYSFRIPSGAKLLSGGEVDNNNLDADITGARIGDFYLNSDAQNEDCGNCYKLAESGWVYQGNIRGETGAPLNVVQTIVIDGTAEGAPDDTLASISAYIEALPAFEYPSSSELIAVNYINDVEENDQTSYWYYYVNGAWGRAQLTGGFANIIENQHSSMDEDNKTYSIAYVNQLIQAEVDDSDKDLKTYTAGKIDELIEQHEPPTWGYFDSTGVHLIEE